MHATNPPPSPAQPSGPSAPRAPAPGSGPGDALAAIALASLALLAWLSPVFAALAVESALAAWFVGRPAARLLAGAVRESTLPTPAVRRWLAE